MARAIDRNDTHGVDVPADGAAALNRAAKLWYLTAAAGQLLFVLFILLFYYGALLMGDIAAWNGKPHIKSFIDGDMMGNIMFGIHVMMAAVMTLGGLIQIVPAIRTRWPALHRWNGRLFMVAALSLAFGGLWLTWGRGSYLNVIGAVGITLNASLIISFAALAWRDAVNGRYVSHRRWALRLFVVANAVWFMRIGYMLWGIGTGGVGIGAKLDGPFDIFLAFANSLIPLAMMEIYLRVQSGRSDAAKRRMARLLWAAALLTIAGGILAWLIMWGPYVGLSPMPNAG